MAFAGYVGHGDEQAAVGLRDDIEVVAADLIAGNGAEADRVTGNRRQLLRQKRPLNEPRRVEILLHARKLDIALVVACIFKSNGGLEGEAFNEVRFVESQRTSTGSDHRQLRHTVAVAVQQRIAGHGVVGDGCIGRSGKRHAGVAVGSGNDLIAIGKPGAEKGGAGHLQFPHHDAQHLLHHFFLVDGGVDLPAGLKQRLQARHLLLQVDGLAVAG